MNARFWGWVCSARWRAYMAASPIGVFTVWALFAESLIGYAAVAALWYVSLFSMAVLDWFTEAVEIVEEHQAAARRLLEESGVDR